QAAAARHVLDDDPGIAGDVPAEVAGQHTAMDVVAAADAVADHQIDAAAAIEALDRLGLCLSGAKEHEKRDRRERPHRSGEPARVLRRSENHGLPAPSE